jgi:hypothetical protein
MSEDERLTSPTPTTLQRHPPPRPSVPELSGSVDVRLRGAEGLGTTCRLAAVLLAAGLYIAALLLPAVRSPFRNGSPWPGYEAFLIGCKAWLTLSPTAAPLWAASAANAAIWVAAVCLAWRCNRLAVSFAGLALAGQVPVTCLLWGMVADCPGFWCWVATPVWLAAVALLDLAVGSRQSPEPGHFEGGYP